MWEGHGCVWYLLVNVVECRECILGNLYLFFDNCITKHWDVGEVRVCV